mmetsp:Transcript_5487/g.11611  ORF Transcript_5487/g.11611 Transcript_5487/m.11611 type:complete len:210 (-) Transcript_5487:91-720(-)
MFWYRVTATRTSSSSSSLLWLVWWWRLSPTLAFLVAGPAYLGLGRDRTTTSVSNGSRSASLVPVVFSPSLPPSPAAASIASGVASAVSLAGGAATAAPPKVPPAAAVRPETNEAVLLPPPFEPIEAPPMPMPLAPPWRALFSSGAEEETNSQTRSKRDRSSVCSIRSLQAFADLRATRVRYRASLSGRTKRFSVHPLHLEQVRSINRAA